MCEPTPEELSNWLDGPHTDEEWNEYALENADEREADRGEGEYRDRSLDPD